MADVKLPEKSNEPVLMFGTIEKIAHIGKLFENGEISMHDVILRIGQEAKKLLKADSVFWVRRTYGAEVFTLTITGQVKETLSIQSEISWDDFQANEKRIICADLYDEEKSEFLSQMNPLGSFARLSAIAYGKENVEGALLIGHNSAKSGFSEDDEVIALSLSELLGQYDTILSKMDPDKLMFESLVAKSMGYYSYLVDEETYELLYIGDGYKKRIKTSFVGKPCYSVLHEKKMPCSWCPLHNDMYESVESYSDILDRWISMRATRVSFFDRRAVFLGVLDISEVHRRLFVTDEITGMSALAEFEKEAFEEITKNPKNEYVLISFDIVNFKEISKQYGYEKSNEILREVSEVIAANLNEGEYVCRYVADVMLVLLKYTERDEMLWRMLNLRHLIQTWDTNTFDEVNVKLRCGIYYIPKRVKEISQIIKRAEEARKAAVDEGLDYKVYDRTLRFEIRRAAKLRKIVQESFDNDEYLIYLQPKTELKTGCVMGAEALVRWKRKRKEIMTAAEFIAIFEKNDWIRDLDIHVCKKVFENIRQWIDEGKEILPLSINISKKSIIKPRFIVAIKQLMEKYNIPPQIIEFEIVESTFSENEKILINAMSEFRRMGIMFSLDNFGKGAASFNVLRNLPIDVLKLDMNFFDHMRISEKERAMFIHMIRMVKSLDINVLQAGVETQEQADFSKSVGCDFAQGYLFSHPIPIEHYHEMMQERLCVRWYNY